MVVGNTNQKWPEKNDASNSVCSYGCAHGLWGATIVRVTGSPVEKKPIQVAIVEDDEEIRANLAHRIGGSSLFRLIRSYADAESALADLPQRQPEVDVVLMDINLPGLDGVECVRQLKAKMPGVQFIMLTVYEDSNRLFRSLMAGANGYLLKRAAPDKLLAAIQEAHEGGAPMTPEIARRVVQHFRGSREPAAGLPQLTGRETEVLEQLAKGFRYKEIVENLHISMGTLNSYISSIYEKLHVHSRTEAVVKYFQR
ncbi:Two component transcriptional regulator, LuxR family [Verrucomicrobia bacterium]|nr:Two component transcriptional regulator, LuxR family [Verrucomicrobiota bacterium]